ncbi:MAG: N-acetylmuramoyl-L-alanine amidase [Nitrospirae bacterium]|nr:N-acetylmuramoyl-L-alanine amidase [Nitrospirota bacterium]
MTSPGRALFSCASVLLLALQFFLLSGTVRTDAADNAGRNQAGRMSTATLRIGKHANYLRLVFETPEQYVQRASVSLNGANAIKVDFQSPVSFRVPQKEAPKSFVKLEAEASKSVVYEIDRGLKITVEANGCTISIDNLDDINVSKLASPSRLVIDAYISQATTAGSENFSAEAQITAPDASDIKVESFVIDAGHGGYESGVRFGKTVEKDLALSFAKEFSGALLKKGKKVTLTRKGDQTLSLKDRARLVNKKSPDLLVSIHVSSRDEFSAYSLCRTCIKAPGETPVNPAKSIGVDRSEAVAQAIAQSAKGALKISVRTEKLPLRLLSYVHVPAVLIELPSPDKFSYDAKSRERLIVILLQGIAYSATGQVGA